MSELAIEDYTIGWICALQEEYEAACRMLDDELEGPETSEVNDNNTYVFGRVSGHNVVIGCLPDGRYGISSAATVARDMVRSFPNLKFALMVGIGGGAPTRERDIRLGDVMVSVPQGSLGGVIQYDFGKRLPGGRFQQTSQLNAPPEVLLGAIPEIRRRHNDPRKPDRILEHLRLMDDMPSYQCPAEDRLYRADYEHKGGKNCANCLADGLEERPPRQSGRAVNVHYGIIASANSVMKDAKERDQYAQDPELNILCFEMEAGGLMNNFPCLVIRGICDYSDSHKNDDWHKYAALTAAAYARELLHVLKPRKVMAMPSWAGKIERILADIQGEISATSRKVSEISHHHRTQEHQDILDWLTPIDYAPSQTDYIKRREPGTGQWLLDSSVFQTWLGSGQQTLFCPGIPGAGKTILTSVVVSDLCKRFQNNSTIGIAYIYCDFKRQGDQNVEDLLGSLLKQLSQKRPSLPDCVKALYAYHKKERTRPSLEESIRSLQSVAALYARIFIILDALDECQASGGCRATFLSAIFKLQAKCRANIFATSRFIPEIEEKFQRSLRVEIRASHKDLQVYLDSRVSLLRGLERRIPEVQEKLKTEIKTEIIRAVDGMFLLAQLYLNSLDSMVTPTDIRKALRHIWKQSQDSGGNHRTKMLADAYNQAMERIRGQDPGFRRLAELALSWITYAERPLTISALQHALAVEVGKGELDKDNLPLTRHMISACCGLVIVDEESNIVRLVHYTAQEYFEGAFPNVETQIATICATYLSFNVFDSGFCQTDREFEERLRSNPLYEYAAQNWGHHARKSLIPSQYLTDFLRNENIVEASSQALLAVKSHKYVRSGYSQDVPRRMTGLHLAAYFGVEKVAELLLGCNDPDIEDSYGRTPLVWAARNGHSTIVQLLLSKGADCNLISAARSPLSYAAGRGHKGVVQLLLGKGADCNLKDMEDRTPIFYAVMGGHEAVIQMLLDNGADFEFTDGYGWTPLRYAYDLNKEGVIRLLLDKGLDTDPDSGHAACIQLLLDNEYDVDLKYGLQPLSYAAKSGHNAVVQRLLEEGRVNADSKSYSGRTPLSWAAENGHDAIVRLLLLTGKVNVNSRDFGGQTPLNVATSNGHTEVVKLLLDNGADLTVANNDGLTPLDVAASNGHAEVAKLLLANGAHVINNNRRTPLVTASSNGHTEVVKLFLENGADVMAAEF